MTAQIISSTYTLGTPQANGTILMDVKQSMCEAFESERKGLFLGIGERAK